MVIAGLIGLLCLAALAAAGDAALIEPYSPVVERGHIPLPGLPAALSGLRLVQLSDLHITEPGRREAKAAAIVNQLQPDLLIVSGDFIQHTVRLDEQERWARAAAGWLSGLHRPALGVWATRGNSDISRYGSFNVAFVEEMEGAGVHLLPNRAEPLQINGETLWLAGAEYSSFRDDFVSDFRLEGQGMDFWMAAGPSTGESALHRWGDETLGWQNYEFSGRFMRTAADGGIGVTFYSQFPAGYYRYYYFRSVKGKPTLHFAKHGEQMAGERLDSGIEPTPGRWYAFRVRVESGAAATTMRARVWPAGQTEPAEWQAEATDAAQPLRGGTVGLWAIDGGDKRFADLRVSAGDASGRVLLDREAGLTRDGWLANGINAGNVRQALAGVPAGAPTILIAHSPDQIREAAGTDAGLVLSGHTHGGQIRLPLVGALTTGTQLGRRYASGLFYLEGRWLYITRGVGTRTLPVRFLCPPEITLITLERGD